MTIMANNDWRPVPVRPDAARWTTRSAVRGVLVVVHNVTSGQRLIDAVRLLEGDLRVHVFFTMAPTVFASGVAEFLDRLGATTLPWQRAVDMRFDLALAAGHEGLHELDAPVIVMAHGAGHNKLVSAPRGGRMVAPRGTYGLSAQWLIRDGRLVPAGILLAHAEELARLGVACPEAVSAAVVAGDPNYDCLVASRPDRARYRDALRIGARQRHVVVTSTWGGNSLLGRTPELLHRMTTELPRDAYRVTALMHPNVWSGHGAWQVRSWLAESLREGLVLIPPEDDWRGVLVSADCVVGDHGSLSLYATATGAPVALATYPEQDIDPASPLGDLAAFAPRIRHRRSMVGQLSRIPAEFRQSDYARVAARITSEPGRFARNTRGLMYRHLKLKVPPGRPFVRVADLPGPIR
ncbi:hypothetical protein OG948_28055 [Embleya sp. NBC_00888]|uniref:hypothetical protein n=1 Tax=Embleya sp. NBC_00888 TaxID=2975960 RepID=UPI0038689A74|nr:hypothetical protein OG948_28055 [Embleya sp. NBC_00888]